MSADMGPGGRGGADEGKKVMAGDQSGETAGGIGFSRRRQRAKRIHEDIGQYIGR